MEQRALMRMSILLIINFLRYDTFAFEIGVDESSNCVFWKSERFASSVE
jgi:hypothetical protein